MATRARAERGGAGGVVKEQFEGRVRKWSRKWTPVSDKKLSKVQLLRWVHLGEACRHAAQPRSLNEQLGHDVRIVPRRRRLRPPTALAILNTNRYGLGAQSLTLLECA